MDDGGKATALSEERVGKKDEWTVEDDLLEVACRLMQQTVNAKELV